MVAYEEVLINLQENYKVNDINLGSSEVIFILESPHVQELKHGVPVAGPSGLTMSKCIFGTQATKPLGLQLKGLKEKNDVQEILCKIGLMNVCQIPMQRSAYSQVVCEEHQSFFDYMEKIRISNERMYYKDQNLNELQKLLVEQFARRLTELSGPNLTLIPCGRFAQKFLKLVMELDLDTNWTVIEGVPHPSYNSWARQQYLPVINCIKDSLNC
ncbi:hypothetical protein [Bacillus sp. Marseille-P3661]|uniref:hypothetical protein n=1 Tax=Bacillus sp. Marseille-P3661 TaxID=1936234 RepID=UPI000C83E51E|nr:hypothetical protein [Bacillus sp. Marseille-P3661]